MNHNSDINRENQLLNNDIITLVISGLCGKIIPRKFSANVGSKLDGLFLTKSIGKL